MNGQQTKRVIVVLSPGRSGTSLLMNALGAMGMRLSENMIPASAGNPEGFFEDAEIVAIHKELLNDLNSHAVLPLPERWLGSEAEKEARQALRKLLQVRLKEFSHGTWGFKDPRTASFIPLWNQVFNSEAVSPVYILALRDPAAVASSLKRQIHRVETITELQWLQRTTDALHHTAADCYIVHYEDWFARPMELAQGLLAYTGLDQSFTGNVADALEGVIKPNLNRAVYDEYRVQNEYVLKLYDSLKECRGDNLDRTRLMEVVRECRKAMDGFKGWYLEAQKHIAQHADIQERLTKAREHEGELKAKLDKERTRLEEVKAKLDKERDRLQEPEATSSKLEEEPNPKLKELEMDLERMVLENNRLLKASKDYLEETEELRRQVIALKQEKDDQIAKMQSEFHTLKKEKKSQPVQVTQEMTSNQDLKKAQEQLIRIRHRYSFRLGKILTDAVLRPGKNTILMPYDLTVLFWDMVTGRGRRKMEKALADQKL